MTGLALLSSAIAALALLLFIYPYLIYPAILWLMAKLRHRDTASQPTDMGNSKALSAALLFCAYNEERALPEKIANIRELKAVCPQLKVYAYSDCSTDASNALLLQATDVLTPVIGTQRLGKVLGMQTLVENCREDVLIFTDANVIVEPRSLPRLIQYFDDPNIGTVGGRLIYVDEGESRESAVARVGSLYWRLEEAIKSLETQTGSMMGADGSLFARRREAYPAIPADLVDDMAVSMDSIFQGQRCVSAADVIGYEHSVSSSAEEFERKRRIACGSYSTYRFMRENLRRMSALNRFKFVSHKLLRWYGSFFVIAALAGLSITAVELGMGWHMLAAALPLLTLAILLKSLNVRSVSMLYELLLAILATGLGVLESVSGTQYQMWTPAKSR